MFSGQTTIKIRHGKAVRKICRNIGFLWSIFFRIWTDSYQYFSVFIQNRRICRNTGKWGYDSGYNRKNTDQSKPIFWHFSLRGVLLKEIWFLMKLETRPVTLLQIYFLDDFYHMCTTAIFYSTYYQRAYFEDCLSTSANNAKQLPLLFHWFIKSCFYIEKAL